MRVFPHMPKEGTPTTRITTTPAPLHECPECRRPFVVPTNVLQVVARNWYRVELTCTNCEWSEITTHEEERLEELDRALDSQTADMHAALELWTLSRELEEIDAFAQALQCDLILPEDF